VLVHDASPAVITREMGRQVRREFADKLDFISLGLMADEAQRFLDQRIDRDFAHAELLW